MLYMISVVIPTFNRGYTLSQVLDSYYRQKFVEELIIVDDGGSDDTAAVVDGFSRKYPQIKTVYLKNEKRRGAPYARRRGLLAAQGEFVLFGDDDDFLEDNYTEVCLNKLKSLSADIVSGRHFYRNPAESVAEAIARFGQGSINVPPFDFRLFHINMEAKFQGDAELPFTHAIFVVRRSFLLSHEIDTFYSWGNGFREESDVQAKIYINGGRIIMTNETHSVHMHSSEVISGGQRVGRYAYLFWSIFYTAYFFKKYYRPVMERQGRNESRVKGVAIYFVMVLYLFIAPPLSVWKRKILG